MNIVKAWTEPNSIIIQIIDKEGNNIFDEEFPLQEKMIFTFYLETYSRYPWTKAIYYSATYDEENSVEIVDVWCEAGYNSKEHPFEFFEFNENRQFKRNLMTFKYCPDNMSLKIKETGSVSVDQLIEFLRSQYLNETTSNDDVIRDLVERSGYRKVF